MAARLSPLSIITGKAFSRPLEIGASGLEIGATRDRRRRRSAAGCQPGRARLPAFNPLDQVGKNLLEMRGEVGGAAPPTMREAATGG